MHSRHAAGDARRRRDVGRVVCHNVNALFANVVGGARNETNNNHNNNNNDNRYHTDTRAESFSRL